MAKLAIRGHETRGKEVIEILEMLGGANSAGLEGYNTACWYIDSGSLICACTEFVNDVYVIYTLEEFLAQFPYKLYDKVRLTNIDVVQITNAYWDSESDQVIYEGVSTLTGQEYDSINAKNLQPYVEQSKEKDMETKEWTLPDGYEFRDENGNAIHVQKIVMVKKQLMYPKTVEECAEILNYNLGVNEVRGYNWGLLAKFQQLLICRDAYWKLAGNWILDYDADELFLISNERGCIVRSEGTIYYNTILNFPTTEMSDAFYENFKDLIEECKELL